MSRLFFPGLCVHRYDHCHLLRPRLLKWNSGGPALYPHRTAVSIEDVKVLCHLRRCAVTGAEQLSIWRSHWPRSTPRRHCGMLKGLKLIFSSEINQEMVFTHLKKKLSKPSLDGLQLSRSHHAQAFKKTETLQSIHHAHARHTESRSRPLQPAHFTDQDTEAWKITLS